MEEHWLFSHWPCREVEVLEEEDVRGDLGLSVFRLRAVSRLTLVVRCTEIGYSVSTQVFGFRLCLVGVALVVLLGCCLFCFLLLFDSAWWNRGIAEEVTMASYGKAVTGTAVMARSANEKKNHIAWAGNWRQEAQGHLGDHSIVVRRKEQKLGAFIIEADCKRYVFLCHFVQSICTKQPEWLCPAQPIWAHAQPLSPAEALGCIARPQEGVDKPLGEAATTDSHTVVSMRNIDNSANSNLSHPSPLIGSRVISNPSFSIWTFVAGLDGKT